MIKKNKLWVSVALMLLVVAIMAVNPPAKAQVDPTLKLLPAPTITYNLGESFEVTINIEDVTNLTGWVASVVWDPSVLNYNGTFEGPPGDLDQIVEGPFLQSVTGTQWIGELETAGNITGVTCMDTSPGTGPWASGDGLLATFALKVVGYGSTDINLTDTEVLTGTGMVQTTHNIVNTAFSKAAPPPYGPTVDFTWPAGTYNENDNVTFTATSTAGYHINTGFLEAMNYTWDFGDGTGTVVDDVSGTPGADSVVTHNFTAAATRTVNVTVQTADNPGGDELETASKDKDIIIWAVVYSYVDVVTVKNWLGNTTMNRARGEAADMPGSAFAPGETVTLVSEALYLGFPVVDLNLGSQVNKPAGSLFASLSAKTNVTGHAKVSFRMPQAPLPTFGAYEVSSTARMFEEDFSDTLKFYVGWIVQIDSVTATDPVVKGATATFNVTVTHYDPYDAYPVVLTVNALDSLAQAIGTDELVFNIPAAGTGNPGTAGPSTTTMYQLSITIPGFAWPGTATVKANAYTDYPGLGGTAYCPEKSTTFSIIT